MSDNKKFVMVKPGTSEDVLGGAVSGDNCYIAIYGAAVKRSPHPSTLEVGESTLRKYALSGQKPTVYEIIRIA